MQFKNFLPLALAAAASAQSITDVLASQNNTLSSLISKTPMFRPLSQNSILTSIGLLGTQPSLVTLLGNLSDITLLAPSNDALSNFLNSSAGAAASKNPDAINALLMYHVLQGTFPASAFTNKSQVIPTLLTNSAFANVTGGQGVDTKLNGSNVEIFSGLGAKSTVTTAVCISISFSIVLYP